MNSGAIMLKFDHRKLARRNWEWGHTEWKHHGARLERGQIRWYTQPVRSFGPIGSRTQTYDDFLATGPSINDVPGQIAAEIRAVLRAALIDSAKEQSPHDCRDDENDDN